MKPITIRLSMKAKQSVKLWEVNGISTPVRYAVVGFSPEHDFLQVAVHPDNIKILRLAKLKFYKKAWKVSKIYGHDAKYVQTVHITLPASWIDTYALSARINCFLRYLLDETWKDF